uniref:Nucleolus and neural progenitor protein n=1 Tax=Cyclopterus lumpus TaxID=8103 RepID=A0A8C3A391_CYCLU
MAGEPWNRVNIAFPGAVSSVRVRFCSTTDLLVENEMVLKLFRSEILQTEVRLLYELLYVLNNSSRGNKTFKGVKQVEQCINRLKSMKLDVALQELTDLCPNRIQRELSFKAGECDVPSQPMLEWLCLKVLGAGQLMSCTLSRCSRAFALSKQQLKWEEFVILNMVITSMLSRLWVIFRGILVSLSTLYQQLLELIREVANAQPMPSLKDFSLPAEMAQFLGPSDAFLLTKKPAHDHHAKYFKEQQKQKQRGQKSSVKVKNQGKMMKVNEDLGVSIERGVELLHCSVSCGKSFPQKRRKADKNQKFKKRVRAVTTFTDMATLLEEMIPWCESQKMEKEKRLLTFLLLKCQRMKCLEAAGYNVQRRLRTLRREACWASSPQGSVTRARRSSAAERGHARLRTRFQSLRSRFTSSKYSTLRTVVKKEQLKGQRKKSKCETTSQTTSCDSHDDIDDIFASVGF